MGLSVRVPGVRAEEGPTIQQQHTYEYLKFPTPVYLLCSAFTFLCVKRSVGAWGGAELRAAGTPGGNGCGTPREAGWEPRAASLTRCFSPSAVAQEANAQVMCERCPRDRGWSRERRPLPGCQRGPGL